MNKKQQIIFVVVIIVIVSTGLIILMSMYVFYNYSEETVTSLSETCEQLLAEHHLQGIEKEQALQTCIGQFIIR